MKTRLDVLLVERGLAESREKAKAIIMAGEVFVDGQREDKAGTSFPEKVVIEVKGSPLKYVSRGGLKLEKAMTHFRCDTGRKSMHGCRCFHRRIYRLHAAERSEKGLCSGCGKRTACMETAPG